MELLNEVNVMANRLMGLDFHYRGQIYNMRKLNWGFEFNNNKNRLGLCRRRRGVKTLYLSRWLIENSQEGFSTWQNTMLHEIAHAIDIQISGHSNHHGYQWKSIALSIGCNGNRTTRVSFDNDNITSKYTMICDSCGNKYPSHKKKRVDSSCSSCGNNKFNKKYILRQVQNY